ncbi:tubby like protein 3 [Hibiscus trionum]|uniref:Tubby like protein 3 n=1 Tax=Hibiscus trionum TaxID=183268 RepID=A0A9W7LH38_HIBTR|nr:tubby like protein 3 [Hibiscus trionum]
MMLSFISRLRSRREVQGQLEAVSDQQAAVEGDGDCGGDCCSWSNLPPELLREVLLRLEDSENCWPERKTVVACAGVRRSWRFIVKEIVEIPEISGKLTFPSSVKQPGPKDGLLQCFIKRNRSTQTYYLYLGLTNAEDGKFLLAARKCSHTTGNEYIISLNAEDMSKGSSSYVGKLRSNYLRNRFTIFDGQSSNCSGSKVARKHSTRLPNFKQASSGVTFINCPVAHISYELEVFGIRGPRKIKCIMETIPATSVAPEGAARIPAKFSRCNTEVSRSNPIVYSKSASTGNFLSKSKSGEKNDALVLINKAPKWHEQLHCWCLNFHGRVTVASIKNFQLVASPGNGKVILQFGKVGKDLFNMDYRYPISAFQAFAICLSSFDTKVACE